MVYLARTILASLALAGISWTVYCNFKWGNDLNSTSVTLNKLMETSPQIGIFIMVVCYGLLCEALPGINKWVVFFCVALPVYCLGHALWRLR